MSGGLHLPETIQNIPDALAFWAERTPHAPALRSLDWRALTHRELHAAVSRCAARLGVFGIACDDRVVLLVPSVLDSCVALLGTMLAAVAVPLNPGATPHELSRNLQRLRPRLVVTDGSNGAVGRRVAAELGIATLLVEDLVASGGAHAFHGADLPPKDPASIATILHTSGTTGLPKRVPQSHRTFVAGTRSACPRLGLTPDGVLLLTPALHTISGPVNLLAALMNGGSCVIAPGLVPGEFHHWRDDHQPTWLVITATELDLILDASAVTGAEAVAETRSRLCLFVGGQRLPPGMAEHAEQQLCVEVLERYGMSEAPYIAWNGPQAADRRAGSCGRPLSAQVRILTEAGEAVAPGTPGEIVVRGSTLFPGYLDDPGANAAAFLPDGWFRTGDLGYLDADGFLFLNGRIKELINRGGEKIAPGEVDRVLQSHSAVAEAATFGVPDARLGEDIVAAVVLEPDMNPSSRELRRWMLDRLSPFKAPRRIWFVDDLPRTATGKVQRGELARRWSEEGT